MNFVTLKSSFANPGPEYRPVPFWFWNSKLDPDEIERQIYLMHEAGLGGFFMHARFGLETQYMSKDWMECVKRSAQTAEKLGLKAWLYDEYPFPSGVGGLKVTKNPELCNKFIEVIEKKFKGPQEVSIAFEEGTPLLTMIMKDDQEHSSIQTIENIQGNTFVKKIDEGDYRIIIFIKRTLQDPRGNVFGPDYLNPDTTSAFLKILDKYAEDEEIKKYFGNVIPGIFTDEPCILSWHQNHTNYPTRPDGRIAAWGNEIPERLRKLSYDWKQVLPAIFYNFDLKSSEYRLAYRKVVAENYIESFFIPYQQWCHRNKLKLTGHLLLEEGLYTNTIFQGDFAKDLSYFDIPGTDHLGIGCENKYGGWGNIPLVSTNIQGQKLVSSVAHLYNKEAVLSESFGVSGWGLTIADMKRIVDWQYRLGINFLCPHAFYYSMEGFRKFDSPPSQFFQATYWQYYKYFADYVARLSLVMRAGKHCPQAILLYPLSNFWESFIAGLELDQDRLLEDQFDFYASNLLKCFLDYDIMPEDYFIENNELWRKYELLILPEISNISDELYSAISVFYRSGGKLLLTAPVNDRLMAMLNSYNGKFAILDEMDYKALRKVIRQLVIPHATINHQEITYIHRQIENKHIFFFGSDSNGTLQTQIQIPIRGYIERWDLETGEICEMPSMIDNNGNLTVNWEFFPYSSLLVVIDTEREYESHESIKTNPTEIIKLPDTWQIECFNPNTLILDKWDVKLITKGDWLNYDYTANFLIHDLPNSLLLMLDDIESRSSFMAGMLFQIFVNENEVSNKPTGYYIDNKWKTYDISNSIRTGLNSIRIRFINQSWAGEPKVMTIPPKLLGNFSLEIDANGEYCISKPSVFMQSGKSWTEQGYPFYSGSIAYTQELELSDEMLTAKQIWINTNSVADMVEFIINGKTASARPWHPYGCEIRKLLKHKNSLTLKVTNSMKNFIEAEPKASGLIGEVYLIYDK